MGLPTVYLAGPWSRKTSLYFAHYYLRQRGIPVVSTWTTQDENRVYTEAELQLLAQRDWTELLQADVLILLSMGQKSEGKATELGAMLVRGKRVIHVRSRYEPLHNIFLRLPSIEVVESLPAAAHLLDGM